VPEPPALESLVESPSIRVGLLTDSTKASIAADSGVRVVDAAKGSPFTGRQTTVQRATFVPILPEDRQARFEVQIARLAHGGAARDLGARAEAASGLPPRVRFDPADGTYEVRVGEFPTQEAAQAMARSLATQGLGTPFVVQESGPRPGAHLRLLETGEEFAAATVIPARKGEGLTLDGSAFRGVFEVRQGDGPTLTVVNVVNLEDYLKGVVPNELSPQGFSEIEALKAQAVAARTYALRHHDQFEAKGYDLCATPSCQVYRGQASEDPLSTRAVDETRGIAAYYQGVLINAYYTSTCGGHTEDGPNIFDGPDEPYLRGVACVPERTTLRTFKSAASPSPEDPESRDRALLSALGILGPKAARGGSASAAELDLATQRLLEALHREGCPGKAGAGSRGEFYRSLVDSLCWADRASRLLAPGDPDYLLQVEDATSLREDERLPAALLLSEGIVEPFPDNTLRPRDPVLRSEAARILARVALRAGGPSLVRGEYRGVSDGSLLVKNGEDVEGEPLAPDTKLFRDVGSAHVPASEVTLPVGEKVSLVLRDGAIAVLEAEQNLMGTAADRSSRYYRWEARLTPAQVQNGIARYGSVGRVKDLVVRRVGVSGRVVELSVVGTQGDMLLKGLKIRNGLGLRENLFVLDREKDASGKVERFIFTGKGWGHGVGLCQVGSYGMAVAGARYGEILSHYYTGISLQKAY
jgi:stage II sporulation protein D